MEALSPGWRVSFEALPAEPNERKCGADAGSRGASRHTGISPAHCNGHRLESADVRSLTMRSSDGQALPAALPGQYIVLRLHPAAGGPALFRSYSLSGPHSTEQYRISVKIETNGAAGNWLKGHVRVGDALDVSAPRGSFVLQPGERPVMLLSAGIGATPVLAMLHALASARSTRQVFWVHAASRWRASSICRRGPPPDALTEKRPQLRLLQQAGLAGQVGFGFRG